MKKKKSKSLFSQAYSVKGDGVAVLKARQIKNIPAFRDSLDKMKKIDVVESEEAGVH